MTIANIPEALRPPEPATISARTLTTLRWVALAGQLAALLIVHFVLDYHVPLAACLAIIALSAALNMVAQQRQRRHARLSDLQAAASLGLDITELSALLYLTGGLENPFSLLVLAPVTVSATILSFRSTIWLCALAFASSTLLGIWHAPLPWHPGQLDLPVAYVVGLWVAIANAIVFISAYTWRVAEEARRMSNALTATQMALAREQQVSALGTLAAAAAHELGSPLSTIAVVATELSRDVPADAPFADDIRLLKSESDRCRAILAKLGRWQETGGDTPFARQPLTALVENAGAPHSREDIAVIVEREDTEGPEPNVVNSPEVVHGLGALIQNAVQFAQATVEITISWRAGRIAVIVEDDGPGFTAGVLDRIGEPYVSSRRGESGHMGLGIFIANTLLERTGAQLRFANRPDGGARVEVDWPKEALAPP